MSKTKLTIILATLIMAIGLVSIANAATVEPTYYPDWQSGNATSECSQAGCTLADYAYKIEPWDEGDPSGDYTHEGNTITITAYLKEGETDEYDSFDWESDYPVTCVIVSRGNMANVYYYPEGETSDTDLSAPEPFAISHVTFCFKEPEEPGRGTIIVKKIIDWGYYTQYTSGYDFSFDPSWTSSFTLNHMESMSYDLLPDTYTVTETGMDGWELDKVTIEGGGYDEEISGPTAEVDLETGDVITITFVNKPPDFVIPENPLGTLGSLIAMIGVGALMLAWNKGVLSISRN